MSDLASFLEAQGLAHLQATLANEELRTLADQLAADRSAFLQRLKDLNVGKLADRQSLANALSKARRLGSFD